MKTVNTIIKLLSALAAIAGVVYIIATYGDQITAWAKKTLASLPKCPCCKEDTCEEEAPAPEEAAPVAEAAAEEEPAAVEVPVEAPVDAPAEEAPVEAPVVAPHEPVAAQTRNGNAIPGFFRLSGLFWTPMAVSS